MNFTIKGALASIVLLWANANFAVVESQSLAFTKNLIENNAYNCGDALCPFYRIGKFKSQHSTTSHPYQVRYTRFGNGQGEKGSLVVSPGRTETSLKYAELAYDFIQKGYSPIFIIDHRGQGLSPRELENTNKGFVVDFNHYVDDFEDFVNQVVLKDSYTAKDSLYLIGHSMGVAITNIYNQRVGKSNPFKAAFFSGGMIKINLDGNAPYFEWATRGVTYKVCNGWQGFMGLECHGYVQKKWLDYDASSRSIDEDNPDAYNMTRSRARFSYRDFLWNDFAPMNSNTSIYDQYESHENWNGLALGGPTTQWMWQAVKANMNMRKKKEVKKIAIPYLMMTGSQDVRAVLKAHRKYCEKVDKYAVSCEYIEPVGGFHELLLESDDYRNKTIQTIESFFSQNK